MKRFKFHIIYFLFLAVLTINSTAQIELGIYAGPSVLQFSGDKPEYSVYRPTPGLTAGAIFNFNITEDILISLEPGFSLNNITVQTIDTLNYLIFSKLEYKDTAVVSLNFTQLPLLVRIISDNQRFVFTSGLELLYLLNSYVDNGVDKKRITADFQKFNLAAQFGFGYIIPIKKSHLSLEFRYSQSLLNWSNNDQETSFVPRIKARGFQFIVGWSIPVSKDKQTK